MLDSLRANESDESPRGNVQLLVILPQPEELKDDSFGMMYHNSLSIVLLLTVVSESPPRCLPPSLPAVVPQHHAPRRDLPCASAVPGLTKHEVTIDVDEVGKFLTITTSHSERHSSLPGARLHFTERCHTASSRTLPIPLSCKMNLISATVENGLLRVVLPKTTARPTSRLIPIE